MSDNMSAPTRSPFSAILAGLIGVAIGAVGAGAIGLVLMQRQQARHDAQMEAVAAAAANVPDLPFRQVPFFDMRDDDETRVKKFGTEFIEDLENNRLQSAYRSMTPDYQMKTKREMFDALIAEHPAIRRLNTYERVEKVRKGTESTSYDFYLTATERHAEIGANKVNFALTIAKINGEWRVASFEIDADSKPKKKAGGT